MEIRPARDDDFSAITAITNHYIVTSAVHFAYEPLAEAALRAQWHGYRERFPWFVIEDAGQVVGFAKAGTWRDRAAYAWTAETGVYLADGARGRGLGGASTSPCSTSSWPAASAPRSRDHAAQRSERRAPPRARFEPVGTFRDAGWKLGAWRDVGFWQKRFATDAAGPTVALPDRSSRHDESVGQDAK